MPERRVVELELDPPRLLALGLVVVAVLAGAFWIGRATGGGEATRPSGPEQARAKTAPTDAGDVSDTATIFDRAGGEDAVRELGRQVTGELTLGGRFELDLGVVDSRAAAERLKSASAAANVPAVVVGAGDGRFRVAAGPFSSRRQAEQAAGRLREELGREVAVRAAER